MAEPILFFKKAKTDLSEDNVSATANEGSEFANYALNRSNLSAWITTGSSDSSGTTWTVDMTDEKTISEILLIKHNFKSFTVKYWDGAAYQDFSPAISETTNTEEVNRYSVTEVATSKIQITINGTMTPDEDKYLFQFIATEVLGQLAGYPVIKNPVLSRNKKKSTMLSGKLNISENVGGFSCDLSVSEWKSDADLTLVETLYSSSDGFLVWLCGGDEDQFASLRKGYRLEDLFLMKCVNDYEPEYVAGMYRRGMNITIKLAEVVQ